MSTTDGSLSYGAAGVNYDVLDAFKRACQREAAGTVSALAARGFSEPAAVRGESCYLIEAPDSYLAHVEEALGTKILVADAVYRATGRSFYRSVAIDDVSTIVNDLAASGAMPVAVAMYAAVGDDEFFSDPVRSGDLAAGFAEGCRLAGAAWSGGETQTLRGMIVPGTCVLGGSAVGRIAPKSARVPGQVDEGDAIVLLASSGVQTNGLTLCRAVAERLPEGYATRLSDGRSYGEALLDPSVVYVKFMEACAREGLRLKYAAHMTGHGWRKLMRLDADYVYRMDFVPPVQPVFETIARAARLDAREMYGTFNMGAGWAAFTAPGDADRAVALARAAGYEAWKAGVVAREPDPRTGRPRKAVDILPLGLSYGGESLTIR